MFVRCSQGILLGVLVMMGCSGGGRDRTAREFVPHMMDTPAVKAQRPGPFEEGMRTPPEGTVAQGAPTRYGAVGRNPLPRTANNFEKGKKLYNTHCIVCHGARGEGDGLIVPKYPRPPTLHSDKVRNWPDERLFHVITMGQNLMPSYAPQIEPLERWAIINYVRALQRSLNPSESDVKKFQESRTRKKP